LELPEEMMRAVADGRIKEGHTRPILMLRDRPQEQATLFKEVIYKKLSVRDTEAIARRIAYDKVRKKDLAIDPELVDFEERLAESLGTRVQIERKEVGGKVIIDFFTNDDIKKIIDTLQNQVKQDPNETLNNYEENHYTENTSSAEEIVVHEEDEEDELYSLKDFSL
jgi:ParB family chromosome partitioning protein